MLGAMNAAIARRAAVAVAIAVLSAAGAAPATAAAKPCMPPAGSGWSSCLSTAHVGLEDGRVRLKRARPRLVVRYDVCPATLRRRTVALRARGGRLLDRASVSGKCSDGVARWAITLRPEDADLQPGAVVRSLWTGVADKDRAPRVKLD
jgi:hypothetical protein